MVPVLQFYSGVCLLMVQVIGVIMALEEGLGLVPCKGKICGCCKVGCAQWQLKSLLELELVLNP